MLREEQYGRLCRAAMQGKLRALLGGPNCRTWSILRWFPKPGAPQPVRGRHPDLTWGLPGIRQEEQQDTDNDSILLLRFLVIIVLAHEGAKQHDLSRPATMLEHPEDPIQCSSSPSAAKCSSIWAISWLRNLLHTLGLTLIHFDQCRLGQHTPKPTTVATNLPLLHWQNLRCNHTEHARTKGRSLADLSRYPWPMMQGLARALLESDFAQGQKPCGSGPSPSDRPLTQAHSQRMGLQDNPIRVQLGFRTRPLRDGGGKPSWQRTPPPQRPKSQCPSLAKDLAALCAPWMQGFTDSIQQGNKAHPFPYTLLSKIRERLSQECQNGKDHMEIAEGPPFFLNLISSLAQRLGDPDWEYPLTLREGVPLGVSSPTLKSPGIWPGRTPRGRRPAPRLSTPPRKGQLSISQRIH